jgi:hypothetical protein
VNWVQSIYQFPVFFWASSLSLGVHGIVLMMPAKIEPNHPPTPPIQTITLIPLPPEPRPPTPQITPQIRPQQNPIVPPPPSVDRSKQESPPNERVTSSNNQKTPAEIPLKQEPVKQGPVKQEPPITPDTIPEKISIETPEEFTTRTQMALTQVTGQLGKQYGDRFAERSETIAASPELFFMKPELFYDTKGNPLPGFDGKPFQIEKETPKQVFEAFDLNLQKAGFTISPLENYGGGLLYAVKSKKEGNPEKIAFYLNLLLMPDKSGTIVVTWQQRPQKQP